MFIETTTKCVNGKAYQNHMLVESVMTPKRPLAAHRREGEAGGGLHQAR